MMNGREKAIDLIDKFRHLIGSSPVQFFHEISRFFPRWMFKVNSGTLMVASSPKIVFRRYNNFAFSRATADDISEIANFSGIPGTILYERFATNSLCYITRDISQSNKIVNIIWGNQGACYIRGYGLSLDVGDDSVYLYGGYTSPEVRMKGIFNTAFKEVYDILQQEGAKRIFALIEHWNQNSYDYHIKLNFKPVAKLTFIIIMYIKFSYYKNLETGKRKAKIFMSFPRDKVLI